MSEPPHAHRLGARVDYPNTYGVAVLTVSTGVAAGERGDGGAPPIIDTIREWGFRLEHQDVVTDDVDAISAALRAWADCPEQDD